MTSPDPLTGRNVFVTGGTGSFGSAFVKHALAHDAARVVIFSRDELKQAQLGASLADDRLRFFLGDVRDKDRLARAMKGCDVVVHAAALKRVESCESNPMEAVSTNVAGTQNVALAAIDAGVERCVLLSTDKAPSPHTLYGATKLCAERLWVQSNVYAAGTNTKLSATRYGNVLGSRGSVLDVWRDQVKRNVPLTVTSEIATRFWMRLGDAVELVCTALREMTGGEVYVPKIGSAPILDLARAVAESNGSTYAPGHVVTQLGPGERMHETLISCDEARHTRDAGAHFVIEPEHVTWGEPDWRERMKCLMSLEAVSPGWSYRSDTNPQQLTVDDLRRMAT